MFAYVYSVVFSFAVLFSDAAMFSCFVSQGALAPVFASCVLFGGYLLIKWFPDLSLQTFINIYFGLLGSYAVSGAVLPLLGKLPGADLFSIKIPKWLAPAEDGEDLQASWTLLLSIGVGIAVAAADLLCGHHNFTLNNILACLIGADLLQVSLELIATIQLMHLTSALS